MQITTEEKQSLTGPLVVGCLFGLLAAVAVVAFASEYKASLYQHSFFPFWLQIAGEAAFAFLCVVAGCVLSLGVLPLVIHRSTSRARPDA